MFDQVKKNKLVLDIESNVLDGQEVLIEVMVTVESKSIAGASVSFNI